MQNIGLPLNSDNRLQCRPLASYFLEAKSDPFRVKVLIVVGDFFNAPLIGLLNSCRPKFESFISLLHTFHQLIKDLVQTSPARAKSLLFQILSLDIINGELSYCVFEMGVISEV